ncbi:MAG: restriction endonuclease subunit S, partial [Desulfobacteraceae bacterium IS3]
MKKNWEMKKLGEICTVIAGQSPEGRFYNESGDGLPFYQGKKEFGERYIGKPTTWTSKITKEAVKGDILMSVRAPVGPINFATEKICIGRG